MVNNDNHDPIPVEIPSDDEYFFDRPFFAYGIFKKGQLAYSRIADFVKDVASDDIPRKMHIRDGIPVIRNMESDHITTGNKIYFWDDKKVKAYEKISNTQPGKVYRWDTIEIDGKTFNVLVTDNLKGTFLSVDKDQNYLGDFDGKNDPFFSKVIKFIHKELEKIDFEDECSIFKIQMYYMLLWSAIDRYCTLKYDVSKKQGDYLKALSNDDVFERAFRSINAEKRDPIYSARDASPLFFNRGRLNYIINYYYTIRSNVVHRGKEEDNNIGSLITALDEMLDVFEKIIEYTFNDGGEN